MKINEKLTHLQKSALEGEIAYLLSTSPHNAEIKFRLYFILSEIDKEDKPFALQIIKDQVNFNENIINKINLESENSTVPLWLWIEKTIADLKEALSYSESYNSARISINKLLCRKKIITSSFIMFIRRSLLISPTATHKLCEEILETPELNFLNTSCFYILQNCEEMKELKKEVKINKEILDCCFDIRERMSYQIEKKALNTITESSKKHRNFTQELLEPLESKNSKNDNVPVFTLNIENTKEMTQEQLSNFLSQKITELFKNSTVKKDSSKKEVYIVRKVFKNAENQEVVLKECKTQEEAEKFVEQIKRNFPDLLKTCSFPISKGYRVE